MNEKQFQSKLLYIDAMKKNTDPLGSEYWKGYEKGVRKYYHGEKFGTPEEHKKLLSLINDIDKRRQKLGQGYSDALEGCQRSDAAASLGRKGGSVKSDAKKKSSAENGKLGGRPKGSGKKKDEDK